MNVTVIGTGYVGLVTGGCLAEIGHEVICTDSDVSKLRVLESGRLPIYEPGLDKIIEKARQQKRLRFTENAADAVKGGSSVPSPCTRAKAARNFKSLPIPNFFAKGLPSEIFFIPSESSSASKANPPKNN